MKKICLVIISLILLQSCKNESLEIKKLREENEVLRNKVNQEPVAKPKFVWTVITYKIGTISIGAYGRRMTDIRKMSSWTDIEEVSNFDYTAKLKREDEFEDRIRKQNSDFLHSIVARETYIFDTYQEASEFKSATTK
ncbi:hypothetical protein [Flavobacterium sp.]|jgi:hypothetical protein|uniref:hypothetical protein n=1 Tax=Flavobacterium sp. TaxID=239 RepID=UPI00286F9EFF|nr:hypothetical protein [Flavobacterium sp.]